MSGLRGLLDRLDASPIPVSGDARVKELTEGWAEVVRCPFSPLGADVPEL